MNTNELIKELSSNVAPVERLRSPQQRLLIWTICAALCVATGVGMMGVRHDMSSVISSPWFVVESLLILIAGVVSAAAAFYLSVPGQESKNTRRAPLIALGAWLVALASTAIAGDHPYLGEAWSTATGMPCLRTLLVLGVAPGIVLLLMIRRAAPLNKLWAAAFIMFASAGVGAFGLQLMCTNTNPLHIILWHFLPVIFVGVLGILSGKKLLQWEKRSAQE